MQTLRKISDKIDQVVNQTVDFKKEKITTIKRKIAQAATTASDTTKK